MDENIFDKKAEPGKAFYCRSGQTFNSIRELEEALLNSSLIESKNLFDEYVSPTKNDFAAWISGVFGLPNLAARIYSAKNPVELVGVLKKYEAELVQKRQEAKSEEEKVNAQNKKLEAEKSDAKKKETDAKSETKEKKEEKREEHKEANKEDDALKQNNHNVPSQETIDALKVELGNRADRADHTFDRVKKIKQHSFYNKAEFEDTVEDVKGRYDELARMISEHRKDGKDMSIPTMMLRNVYPKIMYFQISQNNDDHEDLIRLLDEVEQEIKYAMNTKSKSLKDEIMNAVFGSNMESNAEESKEQSQENNKEKNKENKGTEKSEEKKSEK